MRQELRAYYTIARNLQIPKPLHATRRLRRLTSTAPWPSSAREVIIVGPYLPRRYEGQWKCYNRVHNGLTFLDAMKDSGNVIIVFIMVALFGGVVQGYNSGTSWRNEEAFAALTNNGSVISFGMEQSGGKNVPASTVASLVNVKVVALQWVPLQP